MGLRDKVALLLIWVMFYQVTNSNCLPRHYKSNCTPRPRNILHKSPCPLIRKSPSTESARKVSNVPEINKNYGRSHMNLKSPSPVNKCDIPETPEFDSNWDIPNFEDNFDMSKLPMSVKNYRIANKLTNQFDPAPTPFCFKEKGSFPEVEYPMDVNELRIPNYWNDFIEKKIAEQGKEIDKVCQELYEGKFKAQPKPKNNGIEKALRALIKSQSINKESPSENTPIEPFKNLESSTRNDSDLTEKLIPESNSNDSTKDKPATYKLEKTETPKSEPDINENYVLTKLIESVLPSLVTEIPLEGILKTPDKKVPEISNSISTTLINSVPILPPEEVSPKESTSVMDLPALYPDCDTPAEKSEPNTSQLITSLIFPLGDIGSVTTPIESQTHKDKLSTDSLPIKPIKADSDSVITEDTFPTNNKSPPHSADYSLAEAPLSESSVASTPLAKSSVAATPISDSSQAESPLVKSLPAESLLAATPLAPAESSVAAIPLAESSLAAAPLASAPIAAAPVTADPLAAAASPLSASPLTDTPLGASSLAECPLADNPLAESPLITSPLPTSSLSESPLPTSYLEESPLLTSSLEESPLPTSSLAEPPLPTSSLAESPLPASPLDDTPLSYSAISDTPLPDSTLSDTPLEESLLAPTDDEDFGFVTMPPFVEETQREVRSCSNNESSLFLSPEDFEYIIV